MSGSSDPLVAPHLVPGSGGDDDRPVAPDVLADRDVVDDYALRRSRLRGSFARGGAWRARPERPLLKHLLIGTLVGVVVLFVVGATAFVQTQLARQGRGSPWGGAPAPGATAPAPAGAQRWGAPAATPGPATVTAPYPVPPP